MNYYNDSDREISAWLRELIKQGLIPLGDVDERSIEQVQPDDLHGYTQCHFFCGIAGWSATRPIWTGSCPCQPFSTIGRQDAERDERHLWPEMHRLIQQCRPPVIIGEQVVSPSAKRWMCSVRDDLEGLDYAVGIACLPACSVDAPHERMRLYWVSDLNSARFEDFEGRQRQARQERRAKPDPVPAEHGFCEWPPEPQESWVVDGLSGNLVAVRGYGNAIVPQVAAEFIKAYCETREPLPADE